MAPVSTQKPRGLWWVSPAGAVAMITVPMLLIALAFPGAVYRANWGTGRYLTAGMAVLLLQGAATFIAASLLPLLGRRVPVATAWPRFSDRTHHRLLAASAVIFWVTVFGYVMYAAVGLARGARGVGGGFGGQRVAARGVDAHPRQAQRADGLDLPLGPDAKTVARKRMLHPAQVQEHEMPHPQIRHRDQGQQRIRHGGKPWEWLCIGSLSQ